MTKLDKKLSRESAALIFERGPRAVIITLEPPSLLGFRLKGTRRTYYLEAGACWTLALKAHLADIAREKRAQKKAKRARS